MKQLVLILLFSSMISQAQIMQFSATPFSSGNEKLRFMTKTDTVEIKLSTYDKASISKNSIYACIKMIKLESDSVADLIIYNSQGKKVSEFKVPALNMISIADDGKVCLCGQTDRNSTSGDKCYFYTINGHRKGSVKNINWKIKNFLFTANGANLILVSDSLSKDSAKQLHSVKVFDGKFNLIGAKKLKFDRSISSIDMVQIVEEKKYILFKEVFVNPPANRLIKIDFNGNQIE
jgi:hypothetical protein